MSDYPLHDCERTARQLVESGWTVYQNFTCKGCGERKTIVEENKFYTSGKCNECGTVTDLRIAGCNYVAVIGCYE